ncbi:FeS assembly protein SufD [Sulfurifustis variabilis]|uniref:FeS assembly protein SufD n=1 Tax=Sulfurifustis variabilis TaxID=1675686 RepID=A0A1B4V3J6_9GAMM|nr:Fe-S cluster assembly protein SufD [Sulfurifustis variabilis]BAU48138.1 FeS assembly protein SufD [Sulfurifustis variabilis]
MNAIVDSKSNYLDAIAAGRGSAPGHAVPWVRALREHAAMQFEAQGFPTARDEAWKYTNVAPLVRQAYAPASGVADVPTDVNQIVFPGLEAYRLVFVDGRYAPALSTPVSVAGVEAGSLADALERRSDALEPYLGRIASLERHPFAALNTAFLADGAWLRLAAGAVVERPIHLVFLATGGQVLALPHNLIVLEEGAQATVIEHYFALSDGRYFTNALTETSLEKDARLEHYRVQQEGGQAYHIGGVHVQQRRASRFVAHAIDLGGLLVRNDLRAVLAAEHAECALNGLYVLDGRQHVDNHTLIDHAKPHGTSSEYYKGVLDGRSRAVFNGRVIVQPDAQHTDARQMNNNLLLSEDAEVDTKPELEIYADDVKCSHGATVGQLDADALFYLRSRAIEESAARDLLTYAFANDILSRFRLQPIRHELERKLTARLLHGREIKELELV